MREGRRGVALYSADGRSSGSFEAALISDVGGVEAPPCSRTELLVLERGSASEHPDTRTRLGNCVKLGSDSGGIDAQLSTPKMPRQTFSFPTRNSRPNAAKTNTLNTFKSAAPRTSSPRRSHQASISVRQGESSSRAAPWLQSEGDLSCLRRRSEQERFHYIAVSQKLHL